MTTNMYRVGDYVYFETSSSSPFQIRRIEELNKTPLGNVEAKVMCFYRRRDLPNPLVQLADKHQMATSEDSPVAMKLKKMWLKHPVGEEQAQAILDPAITTIDEDRGSPCGNLTNDKGEPLSLKQRHQMKHRELFLSRQVETLPATHIRGKCSVTLLNETESLLSYLNKDDTFFYCLVFDPTQKTLLADKGEIRVGSRYQTEVPSLLRDGETDGRAEEKLESLVWTPSHQLSDRKIDQFLVVSRSVGTFARALDCSSSVKQPSLHMSAAAASRDITLFHAMDTLHKHNYSIETAMCSLVPSSGPVLCRDEMEEWSASEANLFEEALDKYGKDFNDIRQDFLPWKTLKNIVEYYYMWKTTDRYVQQKRVKAVEAESKLKQVYIPNYTKPNPSLLNNTSASVTVIGSGGGITNKSSVLNGNSNGNNGNNDVITINGGKPCESCSGITSTQWYSWGPTNLSCRLCNTCWTYWKKYGGLKVASRLADNDVQVSKQQKPIVEPEETLNDLSNRPPHRCSIVNCGKEFKVKAHLARHYAQAHGIAIRSGSPRPIMKTRTAFYLHTTGATKLSRRLCRQIIRSKKAARQPSFAINIQLVKQEFAVAMTGKHLADIAHLLVYKKKDRGSVTHIADRLGNPGPIVGEWLILTRKEDMPKPDIVSFPKPPKAADGSLMYERIPNKPELEKTPIITVSCNSPTRTTTTTTTPGSTGIGIGGGGGGGGGVGVGVGVGNTTGITVGITSAPGQQHTSSLSASGGVGSGGGSTGATAAAATLITGTTTSSVKKRGYDEHNGSDSPVVTGPPAKRPNKDPMPSHRPTPEQYAAMMAAAAAAGQPLPRHHMNGRPKIAQMTRTGSGRKQVISWMDAPDDVYFRATDNSKKTRKSLSVIELRRAARKPWRPLTQHYSKSPQPPPPPPQQQQQQQLSTLLLPTSTPASVAAAAAAAAAASSLVQILPNMSNTSMSLNLPHLQQQQPPVSTGTHQQLPPAPPPPIAQQQQQLQQPPQQAIPQTASSGLPPTTNSDLQVVILD